jgi:hypothetical protein
MKTLRTIALFSIFSFVLTSFNAQKPALTFEKALAEKKIEIVIIPTGGHSGNCINIEVKNLTNKALNLEMAPGTVFFPENEEEQILVTTNDLMLALEKEQKKKIKVFAYCTEASNRCPSVTSKFQLATTPNAALNKLTHFLDSLKALDENMIQNAIWCLTDSHSVSNVYTNDPKVSKALRSYLCAATGQKDTWYSTRRDISVDRENRIVSTPKEIKGDISFQTAEAVELQGVVKDSVGNVIYTNPNKTVCPAGKIRFEFKLKIDGWKPGNYSVVYTNNGKEILSQPFSF